METVENEIGKEGKKWERQDGVARKESNVNEVMGREGNEMTRMGTDEAAVSIRCDYRVTIPSSVP